ncbi:MAG: NAD(P)H-dependent oxidoreductase [Candidatus Kerfeldbacteria bacterium]|nr:NAD(P)H-dependent oxidoreductase [Candidatus Kerfeldbacteria bacterium]
MASFLDNLYWRFATKQFDPVRAVSEADLKSVLMAIRLAPTSLGLQPFHVYVVSDQSLKEKMRPVAFDQAQVTDAKYVLVFCADLDIEKKIEGYIKAAASGGASAAIQQGRRERFKQFLAGKNEAELLTWASKSTYIALGFGLAVCAELNLDSCPMEGFTPAKIAEVMDLPVHHKPLVFLAIGYRLHGPAYNKVRLSEDDLFTFV